MSENRNCCGGSCKGGDCGQCKSNEPISRQEHEHNAFIREIKEEIQKDRVAAIWNKWKYWIVGAASLALITTATISFQRYLVERDAAKFAPLYEEAILARNTDARIAALREVAAGSSRVFADMARQQLYATQIAAGRTDDAAATLMDAFDNANTPEFRSIAAIKLSQLEKFTSTDAGFKAAESRLLKLNARAPLYNSSRLALASLYAARGEVDAALATLKRISPDAPQSVLSFAGAMKASLSAK